MELEVSADEGSLKNQVDSLKQYLKSLDRLLTRSICPNSFESLEKIPSIVWLQFGSILTC